MTCKLVIKYKDFPQGQQQHWNIASKTYQLEWRIFFPDVCTTAWLHREIADDILQCGDECRDVVNLTYSAVKHSPRRTQQTLVLVTTEQ